MMLGKRQRPPIKRTTSMSEFRFDLSNTNPVEGGAAQSQPFDPHNPFISGTHNPAGDCKDQQRNFLASAAGRVASVPSRTGRRHSEDFLETTPFLKTCFLCKRRLIPDRDIYMYRGDSAFCSLECRQQKINQDERKDKCSLASKMQVGNTAKGSEVPTKNETVTAL